MERPQYIIVGFENNNVNEQTHDASTFDIRNVTECYCKSGSEFYPEDRMNINYGTINCNEAFKEIVSFNKDYNGLPHNKKPYINHRTSKSNYRIYVFSTRYQSDHLGPQPIQLIFKFSAAVADDIYHALVLTRKVNSVNSDGKRWLILYLRPSYANISNKVWKEPYNYIVIDISKYRNINGKLRINWDRRVL